MPDPFIYSTDDAPGLPGSLPEGNGAPWWDEFFADCAKPCPFLVESPNENLVAWFDEGLLVPGRVLELGYSADRLRALWDTPPFALRVLRQMHQRKPCLTLGGH